MGRGEKAAWLAGAPAALSVGGRGGEGGGKQRQTVVDLIRQIIVAPLPIFCGLLRQG